MKVSIIIPVYNAAEFLKDCLSSIEKQTYKQLEVVFVNDCSIDDSLDILSEFQESSGVASIILNNEKNGGTAFSRNSGLRVASGDYVFFMDADDVIISNCIELLAKSAVENLYPDIVLCNVNSPNYFYKKIESLKLIEGNKAVRKSYFMHEWFEMPWNKLVRKEFLLQNSIQFSPEIYYEDSLWSFETALKADKILLLPNETYLYRKSETQKTARKDIEQNMKDTICLYQAMYRKIDYTDAALYVTCIAQGWLFSQFLRRNLGKNTAYSAIRQLCSWYIVISAFFSKYITIGMKIMLIYRLMPYTMGISFLELYSSWVGKKLKQKRERVKNAGQ